MNTNIFNVEKYFFVIDSENLDEVTSQIYGYAVQSDGIYTEENIKKLNPEKLEGIGTYIHVEKKHGKIVIRQDFCGDFGLYVYSHDGYFAISNSFFKLLDHVKVSHPITLNKEFCDQFLMTWITSLAYEETAVKEISLIPSHAVITIGMDKHLSIDYKEYDYNSVGLDTEEGRKILDEWYEKWIHIIRNICAQTDQVCIDLSGGMDSRLVFLFFLNSGVDMSKVLVHSLNDKKHTHTEDYEIASEMAENFGFELNHTELMDTVRYKFSLDDIINMTYHTKMLWEKEFTFPSQRTRKRRYYFGGFGGELIRPYWGMPKEEHLMEQKEGASGLPFDVAQDIKSSIEKVANRTYDGLDKKYHISESGVDSFSFNAFRECYSRCHFGKIGVEALICNHFKLSPQKDPLIHRLKLNIEDCKDKNFLVAFIFERYLNKLLDFRFDSGRKFDEETLKKARALTEKFPYRPSNQTRKEFHIYDGIDEMPDVKNEQVQRRQAEQYFYKYFSSEDTLDQFTKVFDRSIYEFADKFSKDMPYFPMRYVYSVVGVTEVLRDIYINRLVFSGYMPRVTEKMYLDSGLTPKRVAAPEDSDRARIDLHSEKLDIISITDSRQAIVSRPEWFNKDGMGYVVESTCGELDIVAKVVKEGTFQLVLRGIDYREGAERKPVPRWVTYTYLEVNNEVLIDEEKRIWHNKPFLKEWAAKDSEYFRIRVKWNKIEE